MSIIVHRVNANIINNYIYLIIYSQIKAVLIIKIKRTGGKFKLLFFNKIFSLLIIFLDIHKKHENITNNFKNTTWLIVKS